MSGEPGMIYNVLQTHLEPPQLTPGLVFPTGSTWRSSANRTWTRSPWRGGFENFSPFTTSARGSLQNTYLASHKWVRTGSDPIPFNGSRLSSLTFLDGFGYWLKRPCETWNHDYSADKWWQNKSFLLFLKRYYSLLLYWIWQSLSAQGFLYERVI